MFPNYTLGTTSGSCFVLKKLSSQKLSRLRTLSHFVCTEKPVEASFTSSIGASSWTSSTNKTFCLRLKLMTFTEWRGMFCFVKIIHGNATKWTKCNANTNMPTLTATKMPHTHTHTITQTYAPNTCFTTLQHHQSLQARKLKLIASNIGFKAILVGLKQVCMPKSQTSISFQCLLQYPFVFTSGGQLTLLSVCTVSFWILSQY